MRYEPGLVAVMALFTPPALRISAARSGSPTNVIDFGIFEPTAFSRNVLTNHRALENALLYWLSCFKY